MSGDIKLSCLSNEHGVRALLGRVMLLLPEWGIGPDDAMTIEMVLAETLNNIAEHAFPTQDDAFISIHLQVCNQQINVTLQDGGAAMPDMVAPVGTLPDIDVAREDLPEGGFGWFLIKSKTDDLKYEHSKTGNHLSYAIRLSHPVQPLREGCCGIANGR